MVLLCWRQFVFCQLTSSWRYYAEVDSISRHSPFDTSARLRSPPLAVYRVGSSFRPRRAQSPDPGSPASRPRSSPAPWPVAPGPWPLAIVLRYIDKLPLVRLWRWLVSQSLWVEKGILLIKCFGRKAGDGFFLGIVQISYFQQGNQFWHERERAEASGGDCPESGRLPRSIARMT